MMYIEVFYHQNVETGLIMCAEQQYLLSIQTPCGNYLITTHSMSV